MPFTGERGTESTTPSPLELLGASRRRFLALASGSAGVLARSACAGGGGGDDAQQGGGSVAGEQKSADNPLGVDGTKPVDAVIFNGGYGDQYAQDAGTKYKELYPDADVKVSSTVNIQPDLQPRFAGGNPPDVFDNSGAQKLAIDGLVPQLAALDDLLAAPMLDAEGTVEENLLPGVKTPGMFGDKFLGMNYVYTVFALWHSAKEFEEKGWQVPQTWEELMALGETVKDEGRWLFSSGGQNASNYYQEMTLSTAAQLGGKEVLQKIDRLEEGAFDQDAIVKAYDAMGQAVKAGYFQPGGEGIKHTDAQTAWVQGKSVFYPSGSRIENEQADVTPEGYRMTAAPYPAVEGDGALPYGALHGTAAEQYFVPAKGQNPAGGAEFLRVMLSKEQAANFSKLTKAPSVIKDTVPEDGFGSSALASVTKLISAAGENTFTYNFVDWYGLGPETITNWTSFLKGDIDAATLRQREQAMIDKVRDDDSITKFEVSA
ncbi:N-acetylglucosamine/diacetylchitobiose ABC transporter substrate-binding protein [Brachybacterium sp. EF45031]|uniref:N-acetylglucosamine/diacetylchitobiose ABC transporter substrate-binding protein n=1 Tax=Brachybacterium sillae TaxID=2810536 RepID=UPI00217D81F8|nr:N-acetylglucosamine/diacetylchitobiose ABC transporter substrate-binding protein [Brachybacterium sillae]MCS6711247.1 N-acetylglucosamine/diacetylchitobiose ABC transporter substrate-binding protein [Brachybacterium sillae]